MASGKKSLAEIQSEREDNPNFVGRSKSLGKRAMKFVSSDIWTMYSSELKGFKGTMINTLKVIYISVSEFIDGRLTQRASALTYTTLLSLVPFLAVMLAIAGGLGLKDSVQEQLYEYFPAHQVEISKALEFVKKYMEQIQNGFMIGIGVIILIYTVMMMLNTIEDTFNHVWHIHKPRPWSRKILGYFTAIILLPILLTLSGAANVFIRSFMDSSLLGEISVTPFIEFTLRFAPLVIVILILTALYVLFPNTKVKFKAGLIAGTVAGLAFQAFQMIYISGQLWVTKYDAIYGSFAAIPLLLLYIQFSWLICLFGAQLSYAMQNIELYAFKEQSENISRRYVDFIAVILMKKICKTFQYQGEPYDVNRLAKESRLPVLIVSDTMDKLVKAGFLTELPTGSKSSDITYIPNMDIHQITVGRLFTSLDRLGSEDFRIDINDQYADEWEVIRSARNFSEEYADLKIIDL